MGYFLVGSLFRVVSDTNIGSGSGFFGWYDFHSASVFSNEGCIALRFPLDSLVLSRRSEKFV